MTTPTFTGLDEKNIHIQSKLLMQSPLLNNHLN